MRFLSHIFVLTMHDTEQANNSCVSGLLTNSDNQNTTHMAGTLVPEGLVARTHYPMDTKVCGFS